MFWDRLSIILDRVAKIWCISPFKVSVLACKMRQDAQQSDNDSKWCDFHESTNRRILKGI